MTIEGKSNRLEDIFGREDSLIPLPEDVRPEIRRAGIEALQEIIDSGELSQRGTSTQEVSEQVAEQVVPVSLPTQSHETKGAKFARMSESERLSYVPEREPEVEVGQVMPPEETRPQKAQKTQKAEKPRAVENITGNEVVRHSSKNPIKITPPLGVSKIDLHRHRVDKHTRMEHWVAEKGTYVTGPVSGVVDFGVNLVHGAILEKLSYFIFGGWEEIKHGKARAESKYRDQ